MKDTLEIIFIIIGALATCIGSIFGLGRFLGKTQIKDSIDTKKIEELEKELENLTERTGEVRDFIKDAVHKGDLAEQTIKVLQGQIEVLFKLNEKHGEKMEKFFDQILELGKEK